ncbi:unnamed protein product [Aphanomyces euteiches]
MLRAAPDLGIPMGEGDPLTSIFFADDSTILSNSLESAEYQVDYIVRTFCEASGAALNLSKCTTLALNNREVPAGRRSAPSITLAGSGIPIKYLGIYVGHNLEPSYQIQMIHDKYLSAYTKWTCRARTIQGRRVLASTLILSLIWHVTAVKVVTDELLQKWQRVLTNYILGLKTIDDPKARPLLHKS